jgi:hypothetical protein
MHIFPRKLNNLDKLRFIINNIVHEMDAWSSCFVTKITKISKSMRCMKEADNWFHSRGAIDEIVTGLI